MLIKLRWLPIGVSVLLLAGLLFALGLVLYENLQVAPHAKEATEGRMHYQMKNTTRLPGTAEEVRRLVWHAVYLDANAPPAENPSWQAEIRSLVRVNHPVKHVVVLPGEGQEALAWALPGAYWSVYQGAPVLFAGKEHLDAEAEKDLMTYNVPAYIAAPSNMVSEKVRERISKFVPVTRVAGDDLYAHAVRIAEFRDLDTEFGWGRTYDQRYGYFEYVVATPAEARQALAAMPLIHSNTTALLYTADDGGVPGETDRYVWKQRADWFVTPAEGPFRHLWIVGDRTSYAAQSRLDHALEKGDYPSRGPTALGPMDALAAVLIMLGWASGIVVFVHGMRLLPEVPVGVRIAWSFTALLVPILGVILYFAAYRRPRMDTEGGPARFLRPESIKAAAATAMSFGYGAPIMILIGFLLAYVGFPLFFGDWAVRGWDFLWGAGMVIMMMAMWAGAILIAWPLAQYPIHHEIMSDMPRGKLVLRTLLVVTLSMTAVSLGMMTTAWWMVMWKLPMMPHEDEILFLGSLWYASILGFLIAWPLNYPMVRTKLKMGGI